MNKNKIRDLWTDRSGLLITGSIALLAGGVIMYAHMEGLRSDLAITVDALTDQNRVAEEEHRKDLRLLDGLQQQVSAGRIETEAQEEQRVQAEQALRDAQSRLERLSDAASSAARWRKEAEGLTAERDRLQREVSEAIAKVDRLNAERNDLEDRLASAQGELQRMASDKAAIDQSLTQAFRGKRERLTVLARKTRKLQLTMVLPPAMAQQATYIITDPDGQVIKGDDPSVNIIRSGRPGAMVASDGKAGVPGEDEVKLVYLPKDRLKPGLYRIEVRSGDRGLGSTFIALR